MSRPIPKKGLVVVVDFEGRATAALIEFVVDENTIRARPKELPILVAGAPFAPWGEVHTFTDWR